MRINKEISRFKKKKKSAGADLLKAKTPSQSINSVCCVNLIQF